MPETKFTKKLACNNCPYKKNSPLMHWSINEFIDLIEKDKEYFGTVYGCHKNDGHVCRGWLKDQDNRNFPSIALRLSLSKNNVNRDYLDNVCKGQDLYESIKEMAHKNYKELLTCPES